MRVSSDLLEDQKMSSGSKTKRWKIEKSQNVNVQFDVFIFSSCGKQAGGGQLTDQDGRRAEHCGEEAVSEGGGGRHGEHGVSGAHQHGVARVRRGQGVGGGRGVGPHQMSIGRRRRWQG